MSKVRLVNAIAAETGLKKKDCTKVLNSLAFVATEQLKIGNKITIPGVATLKATVKPATNPREHMFFGKMIVVKAKPERKIVKVQCAAAVKKAGAMCRLPY